MQREGKIDVATQRPKDAAGSGRKGRTVRRRQFIIGSLSAAILLIAQPAAAQQAPDAIYFNGKVITMNPAQAEAEAVAVADGRIVAVGTDETVVALAGANTRRIDLGGKPLLPGFADNHVHLGGPLQPWKYGGMISELPAWTRSVETLPQLLEAVAGQAAVLPVGSWIIGEISREEWPNGALPTRWDLDQAAPDHPVALGRGPHTLLVNSKALEAASITRETIAQGGEIVHDASGEPNGKVLEAARRLIWDVMPAGSRDGGAQSKEQKLADWHKLLTQLVGLGVTSMNIAGVRPEELSLVEELYQRWGDELPRAAVQLRLWPGYDRHADPEVGTIESIAELEAISDPAKVFSHPKLKMGAVKMSIDGGLSAPIMWTTKPYENRPGFHGEQRIPDSVFYRVAKRAHELGWQLGIHVMGDAAVVMVVDQLEQIYAELPPADKRDYLHHVAVLPPPATVAKMARLNIGVASQPGFLLSLGSYADEALGPEDEPHQQPSASLIDAGVKMSYGSDAGPYGPIAGIYAAVTRRGWNGEVHGPEEAVSLSDALRLHTLEPAYFNFDEQARGSIEPGKVADLVVLDIDPFAVAPDRIQDIKVTRVVIDGKDVLVN